KELRSCEGHRERVTTVAFAPDGRTLATGGLEEGSAIRLWEVATGQERRQLRGHQNWIYHLAFSPDGRLLGSGSRVAPALVWDLTGPFRDGHFQPRPLSPPELERCWADLAASDGGKAYQAVRSLAGAPQAVAFLRDRLRPGPAADARQIAALIRDL